MLNAITATVLTVSMGLSPEAGLTAGKTSRNGWLTQHPTIVRMMELQNIERARYGLAPLKMNEKMCLAAQKHAEWMAETGYYMHSNLPWPEIIHAGPRTAEGAVNDWIWSPSHHAVMLTGQVAGLGYAKNGGVGYWVTVIDSDASAASTEYVQPYTQTQTRGYVQQGAFYQTAGARTAPGGAGRGFRRGRLSRAR
jgi:hypothetical protein